MSDETTNAGDDDASSTDGAATADGATTAENGATTEDAAAAAQQAPNIRIVAHFIRDLSFENIGIVEGASPDAKPEITVNVNLDAKSMGDDRYQLSLKINATAKAGEHTRFIVELDYISIFAISGVKAEHMHPFLFIECPRQILPYARRVISDVTRDGGYPPLMIENIDFARLYRQKLEEVRAQQQGQAEN